MIESPTRAVAVCITGSVRAVFQQPVVSTYHQRVVRPLTERENFSRVDTHFAVVYNSRTFSGLRERLHSQYSPRSVTLVAENSTESVLASPSGRCGVSTARRSFNARGDVSVLLQFVAIGQCYDACERAERDDASRYAWILRLRTDLVFIANVPPLASLNTRFAYVPSNGMTGDPAYRCMSDQIFICPRDLCRPYFALLELFTSPYCNASAADGRAPSTVFAANPAKPLGMHAPPDTPYLLPPPPRVAPGSSLPRMSAQWYFFARYSTRRGAPPCRASDPTHRCCGLLREFAWPFTIARHQHQELECFARLSGYAVISPASIDARHRPSFHANATTYLKQCLRLQQQWRGPPPPIPWQRPWLNASMGWLLRPTQYALPPAPPSAPPAVLLGAMLSGAPSGYRGANHHRAPDGTWRAFNVSEAVELFLLAGAARSGLRNGSLIVHVVHDTLALRDLPSIGGVQLHYVAPTDPVLHDGRGRRIPPHDARWGVYQQVLGVHRIGENRRAGRGHAHAARRDVQRARAGSAPNGGVEMEGAGRSWPPPAADACVLAIDLLDVRVLADVRALCARHPSTLLASTDSCRHGATQTFLRHQLHVTGYTASPALRRHIQLNDTMDDALAGCGPLAIGRAARRCVLPHLMHNVGLFGGSYARIFAPALARMVHLTHAHYEERARDGRVLPDTYNGAVVDMLAFNQIAVEWRAQHRGAPLVRGWPFGPLNLPFAGELCRAHELYCAHFERGAAAEHEGEDEDDAALRHATCDGRTFLAAMQDRFFFAHKVGCGRRLRC